MSRSDVSTATQTAAANNATRPSYLVEIVWDTFSTKLCTYGSVDWNGSTWLGAGLAVDFDDTTGRATQLTFTDSDASFRTLVLLQGVRDRRINVWKAYIDALADIDPVPLAVAYGDACDIAGGKVVVNLGGKAGGREFTPRQRIGPGIGVNFTAPPNAKVTWGSQTIVMVPRQ